MRKIGSVILFFGICLCLLVGCTSSQVEYMDLKPLEKTIQATLGQAKLSLADSSMDDAKELFSNISDIDYGKIGQYFILYSSKGTSDEIVVVELKDSQDIQKMEESLRKHLENRKKLFENYAPSQVKNIDGAKLFSVGNYTVLVICENATAVKEAFNKFISQ